METKSVITKIFGIDGYYSLCSNPQSVKDLDSGDLGCSWFGIYCVCGVLLFPDKRMSTLYTQIKRRHVPAAKICFREKTERENQSRIEIEKPNIIICHVPTSTGSEIDLGPEGHWVWYWEKWWDRDSENGERPGPGEAASPCRVGMYSLKLC